jgi:2-phosphosulfolactate phosphatase
MTTSFEWGEHGVRVLAERCDVIIVVDVLSFSTTVDIATSRGAAVFPFASRNAAQAAAFAEQHHAVLATRRGQGAYSLSPASVRDVASGTRLVLPSPNGSTLSLLAAETVATVVAGCLRNASAVARFAMAHGRSIGVIAAGERWRDDQSLRVAIEDLLGAGAILAAIGAPDSVEAELAASTFETARPRLGSVIESSISGQELIVGGYPDDVALAVELDASVTVPLLRDGTYFSAT